MDRSLQSSIFIAALDAAVAKCQEIDCVNVLALGFTAHYLVDAYYDLLNSTMSRESTLKMVHLISSIRNAFKNHTCSKCAHYASEDLIFTKEDKVAIKNQLDRKISLYNYFISLCK